MTKRFKINPDNTCPELAGYKLPPLELDGVGQPLTDYIEEKHNQAECIGFIDGYTKAREKYEFTEEQVRHIILKSFLLGVDRGNYSKEIEDNLLQYLRTTRTPIAIEVEMDSTKSLLGVWTGFVPALNPDGTVKGRWVYE